MIQFFNQKSRAILIFVLVVVGASFIFFGSWTPHQPLSARTIATINGKKVSFDEFVAAQNATMTLFTLKTGRMLNPDQTQNELLTTQTWIHLLTLDQAEKSRLKISDEQIFNTIRHNPLFSEGGEYSPQMFKQFVNFYLQPRGITPERLQEMIRQDLLIENLMNNIISTATVTPEETQQALDKFYGQTYADVIRLTADEFEKQIKPTDQQLRDYYEKHLSSYMKPEQRKVEYIHFQLTSRKQRSDEKARKQALSELGQEAYKLTQPLFESEDETDTPKPTFRQIAEKADLSITQTDWMTFQNPDLPKNLNDATIARAIFNLHPDQPISDLCPTPTGYLLIHLLEVQPSQANPFEDVSKQVAQDYIREQSKQLLTQRTTELQSQIKAKLSQGLSWEQVIRELDLNVSHVSPFVPATAQKINHDHADVIRALATRLNPGQLSTPQFGPDETLMVYIAKRTSPSEETQKDVTSHVAQQLLKQKQRQILNEWLTSLLLNPKTQLPPKVIDLLISKA